MNVYVQICVGEVEEDANIDDIAQQVVKVVQEHFKYNTVTLDSVEVA